MSKPDTDASVATTNLFGNISKAHTLGTQSVRQCSLENGQVSGHSIPLEPANVKHIANMFVKIDMKLEFAMDGLVLRLNNWLSPKADP